MNISDFFMIHDGTMHIETIVCKDGFAMKGQTSTVEAYIWAANKRITADEFRIIDSFNGFR